MTKQESLSVALGYMRENRPLRAEEQCRDFLVESPGCTDHIRLLANALTRQKSIPVVLRNPRVRGPKAANGLDG